MLTVFDYWSFHYNWYLTCSKKKTNGCARQRIWIEAYTLSVWTLIKIDNIVRSSLHSLQSMSPSTLTRSGLLLQYLVKTPKLNGTKAMQVTSLHYFPLKGIFKKLKLTFYHFTFLDSFLISCFLVFPSFFPFFFQGLSDSFLTFLLSWVQ